MWLLGHFLCWTVFIFGSGFFLYLNCFFSGWSGSFFKKKRERRNPASTGCHWGLLHTRRQGWFESKKKKKTGYEYAWKGMIFLPLRYEKKKRIMDLEYNRWNRANSRPNALFALNRANRAIRQYRLNRFWLKTLFFFSFFLVTVVFSPNFRTSAETSTVTFSPTLRGGSRCYLQHGPFAEIVTVTFSQQPSRS